MASIKKETKLKSISKNTKVVEVEITGVDRGEVNITKDTNMVLPQPLNEKAIKMRDALRKQEKRLLLVPAEGEEVTGHVNIEGVVYESYGEPARFQINSYIYWIPKGTPVEVPVSIWNVYNDSQKLKKAAKDHLDAQRAKVKQLYENEMM